MLNNLFILCLKLLFLGVFNDCWLYWIHRMFHANTTNPIQQYFRKCHMIHHVGKYALKIHPSEWALALILPNLLGFYMIGIPLSLVLTAWGIFEAAKGHGHYTKIKTLPKKWYKKIGYAEIRYHIWHHRHPQENLGQFLWYNDYLFGTMAPRWRKQKYG